MRGLKIPLLVTLIVSLGFGVGLGLKLKRDRAAQLGVVTGTRKLKILAWTGLFPVPIVRSFGASENVQVDLTEELTPDQVYARLAGGEYDLVTLLTTQVSKASEASRIQPLKTSEIPGFGSVARDFVDLPRRLSSVVPILWGLAAKGDLRGLKTTDVQMGGPKSYRASESDAKAQLWILNLALSDNAKNIDEAKSFLTYLLKPETATALSTAIKLRTTNAGANSSALEPQLKASSLREMPLTNLELIFDEPAEAPPKKN